MKQFETGDILVFCASGRGVRSEDDGKPIIYIDHRPEGTIGNDYNGYEIYYQPMKGVNYLTSCISKNEFGRCGRDMVRKATLDDLKYSRLAGIENEIDYKTFMMRKEVHESK